MVVAAIIHNAEGKYLAAQRPEGKWGAGKWEFPGGKVERGEEPRQALQRECLEELALQVNPGAVVEVMSFSYPDRSDDLLLIFFECTAEGSTPQPQDAQAFRWVTPKEALELDWLEADWPVVHQLARRP